MSEITLRQMQYFTSIVDLGSVTAAAEACHISQAAVSMSVTELEKSLGADLLIRSRSRKAIPTLAGTEFAAHARVILARVTEAREAMDEGSGELRGQLRIGCTQSLSPRVLPPLVEYFTASFPQVDLQLHEDPPAIIQEDLRHGRLDLALVYARQADPDLDLEHIVDVRLKAMLPVTHRLADRETLHLAEIVHEPAVLTDVPPTIDILRTLARGVGLELNVKWSSSNMDTIRSMVGRGLGYSLVNSEAVTGGTFDGGQVVYLPIADGLAANAIVAMLPSGHRRSRRVTEALASLRAHHARPMP